jgi:hypothetical protein
MKVLQTLAGEFKEEGIYNMDETGLYWRMVPSLGLATESRCGVKKDKSRVAPGFCMNANGTDRFPVWILGKPKRQELFVESLSIQWEESGDGTGKFG